MRAPPAPLRPRRIFGVRVWAHPRRPITTSMRARVMRQSADLVRVVMAPGRAEAAPPFDGPVAIRQGDAIYRQEGVPRLDAENPRACRIGCHGTEPFQCLQHPHAE